jgi:spermidine/putrescine transport system substrate-binding protein
MMKRRQFSAALAGVLGASALPLGARAQTRENELNILCWEGYNTDEVLGPFRQAFPGATVRAETGISDPDMINRIRAGEINVWDVINLNQPWARDQLYPEGLIVPLDKERFMPYFDLFLPEFRTPPYPLAFADDGALLGMPQRYGPFSFVVNTDKISRETAEDQGWNLFLDPALAGRFGLLTYDNWNLIHFCITAGIDPFSPLNEEQKARFTEVATTVFQNSRIRSSDLVAMNVALINGEIDAYFTGGTYTASPARYDGQSQVRGITPKSGPIGGKGGVVWVELTSTVANPNLSPLAAEFLAFVHRPEIAKAVAFAEGTYNPVTNMGDPATMALFNEAELDAIQWDSLPEEMARSVEFETMPDYDALIEIYTRIRR